MPNRFNDAYSKYLERNPTAVTPLDTYDIKPVPLVLPLTKPEKIVSKTKTKKETLKEKLFRKEQELVWKTTPLTKEQIIDGDSIYVSPNGNRLTAPEGYSVDTYESWGKGITLETPEGRKKFFKQQLSASIILDKNREDVTFEDIINLGKEGKAATQEFLFRGQDPSNATVDYAVAGQINRGTDKRDLTYYRNSITGERLGDYLNTPKLNSAYYSRFNASKRAQDNGYVSKEDDPVGYAKYLDSLVDEIIPKSPDSIDRVKDGALSIAKFFPTLAKILYGAVDSGYSLGTEIQGKPSSLPSVDFDSAINSLTKKQSPYAQFEQKQVSKEIEKFNALKESRMEADRKEFPNVPEVFLETGEFLRGVAKAPSVLYDHPNALIDATLESLPFMLGAASVGKAAQVATAKYLPKIASKLPKAIRDKLLKVITPTVAATGGAVAYNTAIEGGLTYADAKEIILTAKTSDLLENSPEFGLLLKQYGAHEARIRLANIQALALGVANGLVSGAASLVTGAGKFEGSLLRESSNKIRQSILSKTIKTPAKNVSKESIEEFIQSASGEVALNKARQSVDKDVNLLNNVGTSAGQGAIIGGVSAVSVSPFISTVKGTSKISKAIIRASTKTIPKVVKTIKQSKQIVDARNSGDTSKVTDPVKAIGSLIAYTDRNKDTISEEGKRKVLHQAQTIFSNLEEKLLSLEDKLDSAKTDKEKTNIENKLTELFNKRDNVEKAFTDFIQNKASTVEEAKALVTKITKGKSSNLVIDLDTLYNSANVIDPSDIDSILASNTSLTKQQINSLKEFGNYIERTNSIEGAVSDVLGEGTRHFQGMLSHVRGIALASKVSKSLTQKKLNRFAEFINLQREKKSLFLNAARDIRSVTDENGEDHRRVLATLRMKMQQRNIKEDIAPYYDDGSGRGFQKIAETVSDEINILEQGLKTSYTLAKNSITGIELPKTTTGNNSTTDSTKNNDFTTNSTENNDFTTNSTENNNFTEESNLTETEEQYFREQSTEEVNNTSTKESSNTGVGDTPSTNNNESSKKEELLAETKSDGVKEKENNSKEQTVKEKEDKKPTKVDIEFSSIKPRNYVPTKDAREISKTRSRKNYALTKSLFERTNPKDIKSLGTLYSLFKPKKSNKKRGLLHTYPDFFNSLNIYYKDTKETVYSRFSTHYNFTEDQDSAFKNLVNFREKFVTTFLRSQLRADPPDSSVAKNLSSLFIKPKDGIFNVHSSGSRTLKNKHQSFDDNFLSAIALSSYEWIVTKGTSTLTNYNSDINSILGNNDDAPVLLEAKKLLSKVGSVGNSIKTEIGKSIYNSLGITLKENVSGHIESNMIQSLGNIAVSTLLIQGVLVQSNVKNSDLDLYRQDKSNNPDAYTIFYKINSEVNENNSTVATDQLSNLIESYKSINKVLDTLFDIESINEFPVIEVPELSAIPAKVKGTLQTITDKTRKALHKYASRPIITKSDHHKVLTGLSIDTVYSILGVESNLDKLHISNRDGISSKNDSIIKEISDYFAHTETLSSLDTPFYIPSEMWQSGRYGMVGKINPQASKIHRHLYNYKDNTVIIPKGKSPIRDQFKLVIAEGLGLKDVNGNSIDKSTLRSGVASFNSFFRRKSDEKTAINKAVKEIKKLLKGDTSNQVNAEEAIKAAVTIGGEGAFTLDSLIALAKYHKTNAFETNISREADGITNGSIIGIHLLSGGETADEVLNLLKAGGISEDVSSDYAKDKVRKRKDQRVFYDLYERVSDIALKDIALLKETDTSKVIESLGYFSGNLVDEFGNILKDGREFSKNETTIVNFGSSNKNVKEKVAYKTLQKIYDAIEEHHKDQDKLDLIASHLSNIVRSPIKLTIENALEFMLSNDQIDVLKNEVTSIYGDTLVEAINSVFGSFIERRGLLNDALAVVHAMFNVRLKRAIKEKTLQRANELKLSISQYSLTEKEYDGIIKSLSKSMASVSTYLSDGIETEALLSKRVKQITYDSKYKQTSFLEEGVKLPAVEGYPAVSSVSSYGQETSYEFPGVGGIIKLIHTHDGAIQVSLMEQSKTALNVHDANYFALDNVIEGSIQQNKAYTESTFNYSIPDAILATLERAIEDNTANGLTIEEINKLFANPKSFGLPFTFSKKLSKEDTLKLKAKSGDVQTVVPVYANLDHFLSVIKSSVEEAKTIKQEVDERVTKVSQYGGDAATGTYLVPSENPVTKGVGDPSSSTSKESADKAIKTSTKLGSSKEGLQLDLDNFNNTVADTLTETVTPETSLELFDSMRALDNASNNKQDSPPHTNHLRNVISEIINPVLTAVSLKVRQLGEDNFGALLRKDNTILINASKNPALNISSMSNTEIYAHELIHAILGTALTHPKNFLLKQRLRRLYTQVKDVASPEMFMGYDSKGNKKTKEDYPEEFKRATDTYNYIFDVTTARNKSYVNSLGHTVTYTLSGALHEFTAYGLTNESFIEELEKITPNNKTALIGDTVYKTLANLFLKIIDFIADLITDTHAITADQQLRELVIKISKVNDETIGILSSQFGFTPELDQRVSQGIKTALLPLKYVVNLEAVKKSKIAIISPTARIISRLPKVKLKAFREVIAQAAIDLNITEQNFFGALFIEMVGGTEFNKDFQVLLRESKLLIDHNRKVLKDTTAEHLLTYFLSDEELTKDEISAIGKTLLDIDIASLNDEYSLEQISKLLTNGSLLKSEIARFEGELKAFGSNKQFYINYANSLANKLVFGQHLYESPYANAYLIANLAGTSRKVIGDVALAETVIDKLTTLKAIELLDKGIKDTVVSVIDRERTISEDNGITFILQNHEAAKKDVRDNLLQGDVAQEIKGYTYEKFNPNIGLKVSRDDKDEKLIKQGFTRVKQTTLLDGDISYIYQASYSGAARWNKTIASFATRQGKVGWVNSAMGSSEAIIDSVYSKKKIREIIKTDALTESERFTSKIKKPPHTIAEPVFNSDLQIVGYKTELNEADKIAILDKDTSFHKALGSMLSNVLDVNNSEKINNKLVKIIHEKYLEDYKNNPSMYVEISEKSEVEEYKNIYNLLPIEMKKEIKRVTGNNGLTVHRSLVRTAFGFRNLSVSQLKKSDNTIFGDIEGFLASTLNTKKGRIGEKLWQEITTMVKDTLVIKIGTTLYGNVVSNNWLLWMKGLSFKQIAQYQHIAYTATRQYLDDAHELQKVERIVKLNTKLSKKELTKAQNKIIFLRDALATNPVKSLIDEGMFKTIVEEIEIDNEEEYSFKELLVDYTRPYTDKIPDNVKKLASNIAMTHKSQLYQAAKDSTQLSDFVARYALHTFNLENGMSLEDSLLDITETFIDYDLPTSPELQYANDISLILFTKFYLRIQKIIFQTYKNAPAKFLGLLFLEELVDNVSSIDDSVKLPTNMINYNPISTASNVIEVPTKRLLFD